MNESIAATAAATPEATGPKEGSKPSKPARPTKRQRAWQWNTVGRVSAGLVMLSIALLVGWASWFGLPDVFDRNERQSMLLREAVVRAALPLIERDDRAGLESMLNRVIADDPALLAIVVKRLDGVMIAYARSAPNRDDPGLKAAPWQPVTIDGPNGPWGQVEFRARPLPIAPVDTGWRFVAAIAAGLLLIFGGYYMYLRRALAHLDPTSVIPERVRQAFDVLTQGVVFLDMNARIVLANATFRNAVSEAQDGLTGRDIAGFEWLSPTGLDAPIWTRAMRLAQPVRDESYRMPLPDGGERHFVVHAAPIQDGSGRVRGCLLTFDDQTALYTANAELRNALNELEASRERIEAQNAKLMELASRDALTGCLNRRALHDAGDSLVALAQRSGREVSCVMFDIDHFKQVNDRHGHAVGDEVIRRVARLASARTRKSDLLCRYGGEEFCLVLPDTSPETAIGIAGVLRATIERECGQGVESVPGLKVTSSFGVASSRSGASTLDELMAHADEALYAAKRGGRNRVEVFHVGSKAA
ncbi:MAG TPA: diguanylate cyclase [Burkholderiaceae bacterium]|nr:diguanylate cyclase [Burkholderiaceae bacterium]